MLPGAFDRGRIIWRAVRPCSASRTWGGTAIISRADCRERRGSSVTRPVRLHAPHSGQTPEFSSVSQRVSRPL